MGCTLAAVEPLRPTVETSPAAHIAASVRARMRLGVSQPKWWFCIQVRKPVAAEAAAIAHPAHMRRSLALGSRALGGLGAPLQTPAQLGAAPGGDGACG